ncbi:MAG: restriction endonuclease subunit S [Xanthomonadales bacterium]|nr:restriction endonuclease subunit S [Xanthomonadales bacterium]
MKFELLQNVATVIAGQSPPSSSYNDKGNGLPFFQGKADFQDKHPKIRMWSNSKKRKVAVENDILISVRAPVGAVNICKQKSIIGRGLSIIRPGEEIDVNYLYYFLKANQKQISAMGTGSTFKAITQRTLKCLLIPCPSLINQKQIAHILGKVESLIQQRKQHITQLDELLRSVFLDMFGDPVRNEKLWSLDSLAGYGKFKNGLNFSKGESGVKIKHIGVGDFKTHSKIDDMSSLSFIELTKLPNEDCFLKNGDVLFVRSNGNKELIGRCLSVYPQSERVSYSGFCIRYRLEKDQINPIYLVHLFREQSFRKKLLSGGKGANIQNINQKLLGSLKIPIPNSETQNQFAEIVKKVEGIKTLYQNSLEQLENLYGSLSQKAFKGELNLSKISTGEELTEADEVEVVGQVIAESSQVAQDRLNAALTDLNKLNNISYEAEVARIINIARADLNVGAALTDMQEVLAVSTTPLEQLRNMPQIASTMENVEGVLRQANVDVGAIEQSADLARSIATTVPEVELIEMPQFANAIASLQQPFESLRHSMQSIGVLMDGVDEVKAFNEDAFLEFLSQFSEQIMTANELWDDLQKKKWKKTTLDKEIFESMVINLLRKGQYLEQVYAVTNANHKSKDKNKRHEKCVALKVLDAA